jgi:dihydrofolate reductase
MRKVILQIFMSLDGFIEDAGHSLDWMYEDEELEAYLNEVLRSVDGMIFGRKAHELLAQYWPTAADDPHATKQRLEAAELMNSMTKYVVTRGGYKTSWQNSEILDGDLAAEIGRLKGRPGNDLALFAGANVAQSFIELGLIDAYRIVVNSTILGGGTPLFGPLKQKIDLRLTETRKFGSGAVILFYEPAR